METKHWQEEITPAGHLLFKRVGVSGNGWLLKIKCKDLFFPINKGKPHIRAIKLSKVESIFHAPIINSQSAKLVL